MEKTSVSFAGAGRVQGGTYDRVKISGAGVVSGDVDAEEFKASGSCKVEGNLRAKKFECAGAFKVEGDLTVDEGEAAGAFKAGGLLTAQEFRVAGAATCQGLRGGFLKASGRLEVGGDVEVETVRLSGSFKIDGLLSADRIELRLDGLSAAREIGGEKIEIRRGVGSSGLWGGLRELLRLSPAELKVDTVEGDELDLEGLVAEVVRGKKVTVGPGCRIGRLEYSESCDVHPEATVGERSKG